MSSQNTGIMLYVDDVAVERDFWSAIGFEVFNQPEIMEFETFEMKPHADSTLTFTDTACDCAESLPIEIVAGLKQIEGIEDVKVEVTWSPAWKITRISRYGRIALGLPPR